VAVAVYIRQVNARQFPTPDYQLACPICGGAACPLAIGVYYRKKVVINFKTYYDFPVQRFLCRDTGQRASPHKTFSLLPQPLVPYHQHALEVMFETVKQQQTGQTLTQTQDHISQMGVDTDIALEKKQIHHFQHILADAFIKLNSVPPLKHRLQQMPNFNSADPIGAVIAFSATYQSSLPGMLADNCAPLVRLTHEFFYYFQTGAWCNRYFLFGTPSQHR